MKQDPKFVFDKKDSLGAQPGWKQAGYVWGIGIRYWLRRLFTLGRYR